MRRWSCFMPKKSSSRVGWSFWLSRCMFGCPDWPAVHFTLLVPIKLPPYRPPLHRASDWSWKVLRSKSSAGRMKIKQGCNNFLAGTALDSQELYDWGGLESHNPDYHLRSSRAKFWYNQPLTCNFITNDAMVGWQAIISSGDHQQWNSVLKRKNKYKHEV